MITFIWSVRKDAAKKLDMNEIKAPFQVWQIGFTPHFYCNFRNASRAEKVFFSSLPIFDERWYTMCPCVYLIHKLFTTHFAWIVNPPHRNNVICLRPQMRSLSSNCCTQFYGIAPEKKSSICFHSEWFSFYIKQMLTHQLKHHLANNNMLGRVCATHNKCTTQIRSYIRDDNFVKLMITGSRICSNLNNDDNNWWWWNN